MLKLRGKRGTSQLDCCTAGQTHGGKPKADNIKTDHWNEPLDGLFIKVQWDLEQATGMADQEEHHSDNELREQKEQRCFGRVQDPFITGRKRLLGRQVDDGCTSSTYTMTI